MHRTYFFGVIGLALLSVAAYAGALHYALASGLAHTHNIDRFRDQLQHIRQAPDDVETIFVGDSSLGNAIMFDGPGWANLALTSSYGYSGSYNMMRNAVFIKPKIKNVVVVQTIKMPVSPVNWIAYYSTMPPYDQSLYTRIQGAYYKTMFFLEPGVQRGIIWQLVTKALADAKHFVNKPFQEKQLAFLNKITAFCNEHHLNCLYMFGPLRQSLCDGATWFTDKTVKMLRERGLHVLNEIQPCVPDADIDSTSDEHIVHELRPLYTKRYLDSLQAYLRHS